MKRLADILLSLAALLLLAACTDDADVYNTPAASKGNLCVYIPVTRGDGGESSSSLATEAPTYNASVDECTINNLHLYAFPTAAGGTLISQELQAPAATNMLNENTASYQLQIQPGIYRVYVVANMNDVLSAKTINTEEDLKNVVLGYTSVEKPGMPTANNIPMIYEPVENSVIKENSTQPTVVAANLKFTCVKVKLNLLFDNSTATAMSNSFGSKGFKISSIDAQQLSQSASLLWGQKFFIGDEESPVATFNSENIANGKYYVYEEERDYKAANEDQNNKDVVTPDGEGTDTPAFNVGPWLYQTTMYLPERYVAKNSDQSYLTVNGSIVDNTTGTQIVTNKYRINLGHAKDASNPLLTLPRGTYYEIIGKVKSLGNITLDCAVNVKDWSTKTIDADIYHTTLWVSKTDAKVTSLTTDSVFYKTNWTEEVEFGCDTQVDGKDVIVKTENDIVNHKIMFHINRNIPVSRYTSNTGTAKVWLKVNNLKKYINVEYNVTPYFFVTPKDVVIYWGADQEGATTYTKIFDIETNLGGYRLYDLSNNELLDNKECTTGKSTIQFAVANQTTIGKDGFYQLKVTATTDPVTTTTHPFVLKPFESNAMVSNKDITVTVKPPFGDYRIYMRAINDMISSDEKYKDNDKRQGAWIFKTNEYSGEDLRDESYDTSHEGATNPNWYDGWAADNDWTFGKDNWSEQPSSKNHRMYMYTQIGESSGNTINKEVWEFATWPGHEMTPDYNNPGWYYKTMSKDLKGNPNNQAQGKGDKYITPGQTLIIFSNNTNNNGSDDKKTGGSYTIHRFSHHMEPGISLFNYEDREGWYLYDPTAEPIYRVYDDKPVVVDVDYTIYTKKKITGWFHLYGVNDPLNNSNEPIIQFKAYYNSSNHSANKHFCCTDIGGGWWKTVIRFKAARGEYDKAIRLKFEGYGDEDSNHQPVLFGGENFKSTGRNGNAVVVEGWTDSDQASATWHPGKPSGI